MRRIVLSLLGLALASLPLRAHAAGVGDISILVAPFEGEPETCSDVSLGDHALPALRNVTVRLVADPSSPGGTLR